MQIVLIQQDFKWEGTYSIHKSPIVVHQKLLQLAISPLWHVLQRNKVECGRSLQRINQSAIFAYVRAHFRSNMVGIIYIHYLFYSLGTQEIFKKKSPLRCCSTRRRLTSVNIFYGCHFYSFTKHFGITPSLFVHLNNDCLLILIMLVYVCGIYVCACSYLQTVT